MPEDPLGPTAIPDFRISMQIDDLGEFVARQAQVLEVFLEERGRKLGVVFVSEHERLVARHLVILDHSAGIARGATESEFDELHVVVEVVDLVIEAVEVGERSVGALFRIASEVHLVFDVEVVLVHAPSEKVGKIEGFYPDFFDVAQVRVHVRRKLVRLDFVVNPVSRIVADLVFEHLGEVAHLPVLFTEDAAAVLALAVLGVEDEWDFVFDGNLHGNGIHAGVPVELGIAALAEESA